MSERSAGFASFSTSTNLIDGLRHREPEAWTRLVRLYGPLVHHWARQCGLQDQDAADVMQEVLRSVDRSIGRFDDARESGSFRGWLWTVTRNCVRNFFSACRERPQAIGGSDGYRQIQNVPEHPPQAAAEESRLIQEALRQIQSEFSPNVWQAFWRTAIEQDAVRDVAEDLKLSIWAVYKARKRVLQRLNDALGESA